MSSSAPPPTRPLVAARKSGFPAWAWIGVAVALFAGSACGEDSDKESGVTTIPELVVSGTREDPVPVGKIADIGGDWRLQVLDVVPDASEMLESVDDHYTPARDGFTYMLVKVALGYYGTEDPKSGSEADIGVFGTSSVALEEFCTTFPDSLERHRVMFSGGVAIGNMCFDTPLAEMGTFQLFAKGDLSTDDGLYFELGSPSSPVQPMAALVGPQPGAASTDARLNAVPLGTPVALGANWQMTVTGAAHDITAEVLAENSNNEPPPDGFHFLGVEVTFLYNGAVEATPSELTIGSVDSGNVEHDWYCGVTLDLLDIYARMFAGDSTSGTMCLVVPDDDLDGLQVFARADQNAAYSWFATS